MFIFFTIISLALSSYFPQFAGPGGMPPIIPGMAFTECESIPPQFCDLKTTRGQCVTLQSQNGKCDIAEKCNGRSERSCSLYWESDGANGYQLPNCVWLTPPMQEPKCDEATKCQGRSQKLCTHPMFPGCFWTPNPMMPMGGMCTGGGASLLKATHKEEPSEPLLEEQADETVIPAPTRTNPIHSIPLLVFGVVSFLVGLGFTMLIVHCKRKSENQDLMVSLDRRV